MNEQPSSEDATARNEAISFIETTMLQSQTRAQIGEAMQALGSYRDSTIHSIAESFRRHAPSSVSALRSIRFAEQYTKIIASGYERYVLTALKSESFFSAAGNASADYFAPNSMYDINSVMFKYFQASQFQTVRSKTLHQDGYDADRHAQAIKSAYLAELIKLSEMVDLKVEYNRQLALMGQHIDLIEKAIPVILLAANRAYAKSRTMADGSGLRELLDAKTVIAIAEVCALGADREEMLRSLIMERDRIDLDLLAVIRDHDAPSLAVGLL